MTAREPSDAGRKVMSVQPDYVNLAAQLDRRHGARPTRPVTLTFDEVEHALAAPLPLDAYERRAWWLKAHGAPSKGLLHAGWCVQSVDVLGHLVTFGSVPQ